MGEANIHMSNMHPFILSLQHLGGGKQSPDDKPSPTCVGVLLYDRRSVITSAHCAEIVHQAFVQVGQHGVNSAI